jgi:peptidoglycan/xylan/chitin deacetylase (PgdA/CDA1 family)
MRRLTGAALVAGLAAVIVAVVALLTSGSASHPGQATAGNQVAAATASGKAAVSGPQAPSPGASDHGNIQPARLVVSPPVPGIAHVYQHGSPRKREIALTFDDGDCASCVARIIRTLARTGAHATIFPNGVYRASWGPVAREVRRLVALGQLTIGDHTFLHHDALEESPGAFQADLSNDEAWIERTFGTSARPYFRPPYGAYDAETKAIAGQLGFTKVIMWSGTVADSNLRTIPYILHAIKVWARPGAIILMHGNYAPTSLALPAILQLLRRLDLQPVTLHELLG